MEEYHIEEGDTKCFRLETISEKNKGNNRHEKDFETFIRKEEEQTLLPPTTQKNSYLKNYGIFDL